MIAALILAWIGLIGCVFGLIDGYMKDNSNKMIINLILVGMDIFVIVLATSKIRENTPNEVKYKTIDDLQSVQVDSVFTKTKEGIDTTYTIHYERYHADWSSHRDNLKHLEIDTVFTKTNKCVDTTYVIKYSEK